MKYLILSYLLLGYSVPQISARGVITSGESFCSYGISSTYSLAPRLILYFLFLCGLIFRRTDWIVGATFSTAMLFTGVAGIHLVAIATSASSYSWDPDSEPAFNMVLFSLLAGSMLAIWSESFRNAKGATRIGVFCLMCINLGGWAAGLWYNNSDLETSASNGYLCTNISQPSPLRFGQASQRLVYAPAIPVDFSTPLKVLFTVQICLALVCGISAKSPKEVIGHLYESWPYCKIWRKGSLALVGLQQVALACLVLADVGSSEYSLRVTDGWPKGEHRGAVGQWGRVLEVMLAFVAAAVVAWARQRDCGRGEDVVDPEQGLVQEMPCK